MRIGDATSSTVANVWSQVETGDPQPKYLEEVAQRLVTSLDTQFDESIVITRVFVTVPFGELPVAN